MATEAEQIFEAFWQDQIVNQWHAVTGVPILRLPAPNYFKQTDEQDYSEALVMGIAAVLSYPRGVYTITYVGYGMKILKSGRTGKMLAKGFEIPARNIPRRYRDMLIAQAKPDLSRIKP